MPDARRSEVLRCGKARRGEPHPEHTWRVQWSDDSPEEIDVVCPGLVFDPRPHSRACGMGHHDHGPRCHPNCPTCHGQHVEASCTISEGEDDAKVLDVQHASGQAGGGDAEARPSSGRGGAEDRGSASADGAGADLRPGPGVLP